MKYRNRDPKITQIYLLALGSADALLKVGIWTLPEAVFCLASSKTSARKLKRSALSCMSLDSTTRWVKNVKRVQRCKVLSGD